MFVDWAKFEADEKDLEYERWCKHFNQERDRDEMARRFSRFKETVLRVEENKKSDVPYRLGINKFADGKLREAHRRKIFTIDEVRRCFLPLHGIRPPHFGFFVNKEDPNKPGGSGRN